MLELNFTPFPVLETNRLLLRAISMQDTAALFYLRKNLDVLRYIDRPPHRTKEDTEQMIQKIMDGIRLNEAIGWAIVLKGENKLSGTISFHRIEKENYRAEIGYMMHPEHWRKGYTHEAMVKVIDYGFHSMKLHSIEANINPDNSASANLLLKNGFVREACFRENYYFNGNFLDTEIYSLLKSES
jgi:ribosomal-protein-alanine N-acetyltransferase